RPTRSWAPRRRIRTRTASPTSPRSAARSSAAARATRSRCRRPAARSRSRSPTSRSPSGRVADLPHRFPDRTEIAEVRARHEGLAAGESSGCDYRLAGRVLGRRGQGKLTFLDLEDRSGRLQLLASQDVLGDEAYARVRDVKLGDIVGV